MMRTIVIAQVLYWFKYDMDALNMWLDQFEGNDQQHIYMQLRELHDKSEIIKSLPESSKYQVMVDFLQETIG